MLTEKNIERWEAAEDWDLIIRPQSKLFNLHLKEVWHYRDLLLLLVKRDFVSFYKQTILGPVWFFLQPVFTTIVFTLVFGRLAGIQTDDIPHPVFYLIGITAWNYFSDGLVKTSTVFKDNANVFGKVYFPRLIMPLSIVISNLVKFMVQVLLLLLVMGFYCVKGFVFHPNWSILIFPYLVLLMAALGLGSGMIISALTTKYRDLAFLLNFGVQLLMYGTTVIYPLSTVMTKYPKLVWWFQSNPMTPIIETFRYGLVGKGTFSISLLAYSSLTTGIILFAGVVIFNKVEKNFVDTV